MAGGMIQWLSHSSYPTNKINSSFVQWFEEIRQLFNNDRLPPTLLMTKYLNKIDNALNCLTIGCDKVAHLYSLHTTFFVW